MERDEFDRLHAELVSAFFHPPRVIACGHRTSGDGATTIISHVELWPWRTIVSGSYEPSDGLRLGSLDGSEGRWDWQTGWALADDVETTYPPSGAGARGDGFCMDFQVRFGASVPSNASRLLITSPEGQHFEVVL